jgi:hypothetical protein
MRLFPLIAVASILFVSTTTFAQDDEWITYESKEDRFTVNFPSQPKMDTITWPSEYGAVFPGRVHSVTVGPSKYSVTVIDYTDAERIHSKIAKPESFQQAIYWQIDIQASIQYAATKFRMRPGAKVTYDAWHYIDLVEGHQLQITNADQSKTFVGIYLHENRLYILEATVPRLAAPPGLFQQSLSFLDEKGARVRYNAIYSNRLPPMTLGGRGGRGGGGGRGNQGGQDGQQGRGGQQP